MQRLSGLDAAMLSIDSSRFIAFIGSCVILEGDIDLERFTALIESRLDELPLIRRKLAEVPLGLGLPYWVDDDRFDLEFHLRESAIPAPGTPQQLSYMIARTFSRPLDRDRPLWEMWLVHGLEGGRVALLTKFHHALVDGVSGNEMMGRLLDQTPDGRETSPPRPWRPPAPPTPLRLLRGGLTGLAGDSLRAARSVPTIAQALLPGADRLPGAGLVRRLAGVEEPPSDVLELSGGAAPATPFNGVLSAHRRYAYGTLELDRIKAVKSAAGVTVNDVVVTLCASATRAWLSERDALPDAPLITAVPISVRTGDEGYGNQIGMMTAPIATNVADPLERLHLNAQAMRGAKERHGALPAEALTDVATFLPPAVAARATRTALGVLARVQPPVNLLISNVPGPRESLYCAGAEMTGYFPVPPIIDGVGLNYTVVSYRDELEIGITTDRDQIPDPFDLQTKLAEALEELEAAG